MCRHVQRISPVHTTCSVSEASLRAAVLQIAAQHAAVLQRSKDSPAAQPPSQQHATTQDEAAGEKGSATHPENANESNAEGSTPAQALRMRFAIAFRSRAAEPGPIAAGAPVPPPDTRKVCSC